MFVILQGVGSALLLTAGFVGGAAGPTTGGSIITQGFGTPLAITQGYTASTAPVPPEQPPGGIQKRQTKRFHINGRPYDVPVHAIRHFIAELEQGDHAAHPKKKSKPLKVTVKAIAADGSEQIEHVPFKLFPWMEGQEWLPLPDFGLEEIARLKAAKNPLPSVEAAYNQKLSETDNRLLEIIRVARIKAALELLLLDG